MYKMFMQKELKLNLGKHVVLNPNRKFQILNQTMIES